MSERLLAQTLPREFSEGDVPEGGTRKRELVNSTPLEGLDTRSLYKLARIRYDRFLKVGELNDLEKAIEYGTRAVSVTPEGHSLLPYLLNDLGESYTSRYRRLGGLGDLTRAVEYNNRALEVTPCNHPDEPVRLAMIGASYTDLYCRLGESTDLEKSITYNSRTLELTPDNHPQFSYRLTRLGVSYVYRYQRLGGLDNLEKSIRYLSHGLTLTPDGHLEFPRMLVNLGFAYSERYRHLGEHNDLEKSIQHTSRSLALTPDDHPSLPQRLNTLGACYGDLYRRTGKLKDLEKSIECDSRALELTPDGHADLSSRLASLGVSYEDRYRCLRELDDLAKAIDYKSRALGLTPKDHRDFSNRLGELGLSYGDRYRHLQEFEDLEKSMEYNFRALKLTPDGHPQLSRRHCLWALSCFEHHERIGDPSDLSKSLDSFRKSSQLSTGAPRDAFVHAFRWAKLASTHSSLSCLEAFHVTISLLPQFICLGATTTQRYYDLSLTDNVAVQAASAAIAYHNYDLALEWLEHARCVVWNQNLMLRSPLDRLRTSYPDLAARLQRVAQLLHGVSSEHPSSCVITSDPVSPEHRRRLAMEYNDLLIQARQLPGFEDFLLPMKSSGLTRAAQRNPIVVLVCHKDRCDALLMLPGQDNVTHLPPPNFTENKARHARSEIETSLRRKGLRERGVRKLQERAPNHHIGIVLATLWKDIVKPILDHLSYVNDILSDSLPHITWCPTGALSFLPLHAAGDYEKPRSRAFDYVVSSYIPSVSALLTTTPSMLNCGSCLLAIGQAATPGHSPLPGTIRELEYLEAHAQGRSNYSQLIGSQATTTAVLDAMEQHDWVHLACHAHQNIDDPTKSGFYLHDGTLDLATISQRSFKNKGLAFLSACQTAAGDEKLPDEAIHLASGMLMAGYPSVIATLWSVIDDDAPFVADKVYAQLMKDGKVGNGQAGRALHDAAAALREKVGEHEFSRWVPYVHIGS